MAWSRELIVSREGGNRGGHLCDYSMKTAENSIILLHEPGHLPVQVVVAHALEGCYVNKETAASSQPGDWESPRQVQIA